MDLGEFGMSRLATDWSELRAWSASHDAELRLCLRSTTAGVLTLAAAQLLNLPIALWAVLTAVILTQISVGCSKPKACSPDKGGAKWFLDTSIPADFAPC